MNIKIPDSWLKEYLKTEATPNQIQKYLSLCGPSVEKITKISDDYVYDIEITTNRIDTVSILGIAREAVAILPRFGIKADLKPLKLPDMSPPKQSLPLTVKDPEKLCARHLAIVMDNVEVGPSDPIIKDRLEKSGLRSLNNVIDITNYVMLELGHPVHVFDYDRIKTTQIILRRAKKGEKLVTFDNQVCHLDDRDVVIDDGTGRIIDLPGIIGTKNSVVTPKTTRVVVFIESNNPTTIRRTSIRLGLKTLAASINEKHPDEQLAKMAMLYAIQLYQKLLKAKKASNLIDIYPNHIKPKSIKITSGFIRSRIGVKIDQEEIREILQSLGFIVKIEKSQFTVISPSYRQSDIQIKEDIIEEIARLYGYHILPSKLMDGDIPIAEKDKGLTIEDNIKTMLKYWGYTETYSYSFISKKLIKACGLLSDNHLKVSNPLTTDFEYMRVSLIPSMLENLTKNQHLQDNLKLFELAKVYLQKKDSLPAERSMLVIADKNFYKLKGIIETILNEFGILKPDINFKEFPFWHPKQLISLTYKNETVATIGKLHPKLKEKFALLDDFFICEANIDLVIKYSKFKKQYRTPSLYPPMFENLALKIQKSTKLGLLIDYIYKITPLVTKVQLVDRYKDITTLKLTYLQTDKNLTSEKVKQIRNLILKGLENKFKARLKS